MLSTLDVHVVRRGRAAVITLRGAADLFTASVLRDRLAEVRDAGVAGLVVDLGELRFIDSSGLAVLLEAHRTFLGAVTLVGASGLVRRVLEAAATDSALDTYDLELGWLVAPP